MNETGYRTEHDLLGDREIPDRVHWGIHTLRAVENFPVTGTTVALWPDLVRALVDIKAAAARANAELGLDRKSTRLNSSHIPLSRMPSSA